MARHAPQLFGDEIRLPVVVVDAVDHGVLKADAPSRFLKIAVAGIKQQFHVIGAVHRHDAAARLAVRRVQRDRQRQLQLLLRQGIDTGHHAAGGQADMPHTDVHAIGMIHQLQKPQHIGHVVQRLADAHQHNVGHRPAGIQLGEHHLIQHFRRPQIPHLSGDGAGTEGAAHTAAHLGRDAHRVAMVVLHQHRLDAVAVRQFPQVLDGAVQPRLLFAGHHRRGDKTPLLQLFPQGLGEVGHLVEGGGAPMQPRKDLLGAERRLSQLFQKLGELLLGHGFDIGHKSSSLIFCASGRYRSRPCRTAAATASAVRSSRRWAAAG